MEKFVVGTVVYIVCVVIVDLLLSYVISSGRTNSKDVTLIIKERRFLTILAPITLVFSIGGFIYGFFSGVVRAQSK